ncbi:MAG: hypothetical protein R3E96_05765 [Planctomycetota bacterium]
MHVSSVAAVGSSRPGETTDESAPFRDGDVPVAYLQSKHAGEVYAMGDWGELEVVTVCPGAIFGRCRIRRIRRASCWAWRKAASARGSARRHGGGRGRRLRAGRARPSSVWRRRAALYILTERYLSTRELFAVVGADCAAAIRSGSPCPRPVWGGIIGLLRAISRPGTRAGDGDARIGAHARVGVSYSGERARRELGWCPRPFDAVLEDLRIAAARPGRAAARNRARLVVVEAPGAAHRVALRTDTMSKISST